MVEVWDGSMEEGCWAPRFVRAFNDWELETERFLLKLLGKLLHILKDNVVWVGAKDDKFVVKQLCGELVRRTDVHFPSKVIWNAWVPSKVRIFT